MTHTPTPETQSGSAATGVQLDVRDGVVRVVDASATGGSAELSWSADAVEVHLFGERVEGTSCRVPGGAALRVLARRTEPSSRCIVTVARDRMGATLRIVPAAGVDRMLRDAAPTASLRLEVEEARIEPITPSIAEAKAALQSAQVVSGIEAEALETAIVETGIEHVVARGLEPIEGRNGALEHLVDFHDLRAKGVLEGTPLVRRIPSRDGVPGRDVTGQEIRIAAIKDVRLRPGVGVSVDERGLLAVAQVDGAPHIDHDGRVEVRHELVLEAVDTVTGDVVFHGTVRIDGDVTEGRRVIARDSIIVGGTVERAHLESGGSIEVNGSIMSSTLRAGGERAVAATIADRVLDLPHALGLASLQARQFRDVATKGGKEFSHGLSIQLVMERHHRQILVHLASIVEDLREAGPAHLGTADDAAHWLRQLSTAANISLTPEQFGELLIGVGALADDVQRAIEQPADLVVSYMQASEAEATGLVTITGKGIFNSRVVAWGGLSATNAEAVVRGGSVIAHGPVRIREVGSPAGAKTVVQLGSGGGLEAERAYAGAVVIGPSGAHRFVADRSSVKVDFDGGGMMNVESLAA
ncbi:MAG: DUF342 domain-containing protein [Thermoleophilia bacterium]|nr:DUF342 domain-containing protein [Thermoleophilia bacterium]